MQEDRSSAVVLLIVLCCISLGSSVEAGPPGIEQKTGGRRKTAGQQNAITQFEQAVKDYVKLREGLEEKLPSLSKDSTPEQIEAHKAAFEDSVRAARSGAKQGDVFSPEVANLIRNMMKREFKGRRLRELRETIMDAETKGVLLRVNYPYPESKELAQSSAPLLMRLPKLPKQVKYRFVGRHMLLVDRENGLILDYIRDVLP